MSNHVHLLLRVPHVRILSKAIKNINVSYAMYFNNKYRRIGHLFQDRFISWVVETENHLLEAKTYIEANPIRAGIVKKELEYPWSSASGDGDGPIINVDPIRI